MERYLPEEHQFNTAVHDAREPIVDELFALADAGDIVDVQAEFSRPYEALWGFSGKLAETMKSETEPSLRVQAAMYRGMAFALQVVEEIKSAPIKTITPHYWDDSLHGEELERLIHGDVNEYLATRPHVESLISSFMSEIDTTFMASHHAEIAAGLMFMVCEREQAEDYLKGQSETLSPDTL